MRAPAILAHEDPVDKTVVWKTTTSKGNRTFCAPSFCRNVSVLLFSARGVLLCVMCHALQDQLGMHKLANFSFQGSLCLKTREPKIFSHLSESNPQVSGLAARASWDFRCQGFIYFLNHKLGV